MPEAELYLTAKYRLINLKSYYMANEHGRLTTDIPFDDVDNSVIDLAISLIDEKLDGFKEARKRDAETVDS